MGMFDDIIIEEDLVELGIPKGNYQTKDLNCGLDRYTIDKGGNIILTGLLDEDSFRYWDECIPPPFLPAKLSNVNFHLNIYGSKIQHENEIRDWLEFVLTIKDGEVVDVKETMQYPVNYVEANLTEAKWTPVDKVEDSYTISNVTKKK